MHVLWQEHCREQPYVSRDSQEEAKEWSLFLELTNPPL